MTREIYSLFTHKEILLSLGRKVRARRQHLDLTRRELSAKSGVSEPTIVRLESTGISTTSVLIKIAMALNALDELERLFSIPEARSMDEFIARHTVR